MKSKIPPCIIARRRFAAILASLLCIPQFALGMGPVPTPPLVLPFAANKKGEVIDITLRVKEHRPYKLELHFRHKPNDWKDQARVGLLLSELHDEQGRRQLSNQIVVHISVADVGTDPHRTIFERRIDSYEGGAIGGDRVFKTIATVKLKPGLYRFQIEALNDAPALDGLPIEFHIGWYAKASPIND